MRPSHATNQAPMRPSHATSPRSTRDRRIRPFPVCWPSNGRLLVGRVQGHLRSETTHRPPCKPSKARSCPPWLHRSAPQAPIGLRKPPMGGGPGGGPITTQARDVRAHVHMCARATCTHTRPCPRAFRTPNCSNSAPRAEIFIAR